MHKDNKKFQKYENENMRLHKQFRSSNDNDISTDSILPNLTVITFLIVITKIIC